MVIFIASFLIIAIAISAMAIGILVGRPAIKGSCGGLNNIGISSDCGGACSVEEQQICALKKQHNKAQ